jgi:NitT/TauT family transport system ATP-binding protein
MGRTSVLGGGEKLCRARLTLTVRNVTIRRMSVRDAGLPASAAPSSLRPAARGEICLSGVGKTFGTAHGDVQALAAVDLTIPEGQFLTIVGPSGCGKTTLLRILAGLAKASSGTVTFSIDHAGRPLRSMIFQEQGVFPWLTVLDNAAFGLKCQGIGRTERRKRAREYLEMLGLGPFERAYPRQLSGGMRQRVNIARAFANDPAVLLMDEPLSALDEQTKLLVQADLLNLWEKTRKTVVYITHSLDEAIILGDRVIVMTNRPGKLKATFDVMLPRPRNVIDMQSNPEFFELRSNIWTALRDEVLSLRRTEGTTDG